MLDPKTGDYKPEGELKLPNLDYIDDVSTLYRQGRYAEGMQVFLGAEGDEADIARKVIAGYISYAFHRVGEVTEVDRRHRPHHGNGLQLGAAQRAGRRDGRRRRPSR